MFSRRSHEHKNMKKRIQEYFESHAPKTKRCTPEGVHLLLAEGMGFEPTGLLRLTRVPGGLLSHSVNPLCVCVTSIIILILREFATGIFTFFVFHKKGRTCRRLLPAHAPPISFLSAFSRTDRNVPAGTGRSRFAGRAAGPLRGSTGSLYKEFRSEGSVPLLPPFR